MRLIFERASLEYTCESIFECFDESQSIDFQEYICKVYPTFDLEKIKKMDLVEKSKYIKREVENLYNSQVSNINQRVNEYQKEWDEIGSEILKCYKSIFNIMFMIFLINS